MSDAHPLLELQRLDDEVAALHARREALPERGWLDEGERTSAEIVAQRAALHAEREALAREERQIDADVADAAAKAHEIEASLYSGSVRVVKELEALDAELRMIQRRQHDREDAELALMEREEGLDAEIAALDARSAGLATGLATWRAALAAAEAAIDAELAQLASARAAIAARVAPATVATYEKLRTVPRFHGRVVAGIEGFTCNGCWGGLPTAFASRFAREPAGATAECPRCGRLLLKA